MSFNIFKGLQCKNRDVIEHYLEQRGPVCNTQRHEQDAMCNTSLSFLHKHAVWGARFSMLAGLSCTKGVGLYMIGILGRLY